MNRLNYIPQLKKGKRNYLKYIQYPTSPLDVNDIYIITRRGDRLDLLANHYYKDPTLWWIISNANPDVVKRDSLNITPGSQIRIPSGYLEIIEGFKKRNK